MRNVSALRACALVAGILTALTLSAQEAPAVPSNQPQGIPPRATPADYQFKVQVGKATIAAEFLGHSIPTPQGGTYLAEEHVVVEVAVFGPPNSRIMLAASDFSIRLNGKKAAIPADHFGLVFRALKDPEWGPLPSEVAKSKTNVGGLSGGGGGGGSEPPPPPPKMPIPLRRAMEQKVQKAALPEGDRVLPQAGLIFFTYRGKAEGIHAAELIYNGPAGKAKMSLR